MVLLPKSTDTTNPTSYRPVSFLSVLSKFLEKHMHIYLNVYLEQWELLHPLQSGFRHKYSCSTALVRLTNSYRESVKYGATQSSVLGPILFSLFINDLPLYVKKKSLLIVTCWQMTQHCINLKNIFCKSEAICKIAQIRYPTGVVIIICSSIQLRPSLCQLLPDRNTSCHARTHPHPKAYHLNCVCVHIYCLFSFQKNDIFRKRKKMPYLLRYTSFSLQNVTSLIKNKK